MIGLLAWLASPLGRLAGFGALAVVLLLSVLGVKHEWDAGQRARRQISVIVHASRAHVKVVAKADRAAVKTATVSQTRIITRTRTLIEKVPVYVSVSAPCIPWGVVRLHDAAVIGVDPGSLHAPAGQSDDACSDITPRALVGAVIANYGLAQQNAQQLNDLEADLAARGTPY